MTKSSHCSLGEFRRVLRPDGRLAISDMYTRADCGDGWSWPVPCCFAGAGDLANVRKLPAASGFSVIPLEDRSRHHC